MARDDIEDVEVDVDLSGGDFPQPEMTITLQGDFSLNCEAFIENDDVDHPDYCKMRFRISRNVAEKLVKQVSEYL